MTRYGIENLLTLPLVVVCVAYLVAFWPVFVAVEWYYRDREET